MKVRRHASLGGRCFEVPAVAVEVLQSLYWRYNWSWWLVNKMKMRFRNEEILSFTPQCILEISCWRHCWQTNRSSWKLNIHDSLLNKILSPPFNSWSKPRPSSCLMRIGKRRRVESLWEARIVVVWRVPEQPRMLLCPLTISSPHCTWGCCEWRGKETSGGRGHRNWRRVRDDLCGWTSVNCWSVLVGGSHFWGGSREGWSHFGNGQHTGYCWTTIC